jgi:undecaprenyl diphosphate synthase
MQVNHLGIIPDGNRRWARQQNKPDWQGHKAGIESFRSVIDWCIEFGIHEITFYTLSVQNFKRSKLELSYLFKFVRNELDRWLASNEIDIQGIFLNPVGRLNLLPADIKNKCDEIKEKTKNNNKIKVNLAIGYGGREEILEAISKLNKNRMEISEKNISANLWIPSDVDLVIRTSGEMRTSNFLIWQAHYAEWFFSKKYWPEFNKEEFKKAISSFEKRERRFGGNNS